MLCPGGRDLSLYVLGHTDWFRINLFLGVNVFCSVPSSDFQDNRKDGTEPGHLLFCQRQHPKELCQDQVEGRSSLISWHYSGNLIKDPLFIVD